MTSPNYWQKRRKIADKAIQAALKVRTRGGVDMKSPLCIYDLCENLGITVRFNEINMEGIYRPGPPPQIHLSVLRPLGRRRFNCAHELGHYAFGHGARIDELREQAVVSDGKNDEELLADIFAGSMLMPTIGLRRAFTDRTLTPQTAFPRDLFSIACNFGVGYSTLVNHLCYGVREIPKTLATAFLKSSPKSIRLEICPDNPTPDLIYADDFWNAQTMDAEVGMNLILPNDSLAETKTVMPIGQNEFGLVFKATKPGISRVQRPPGKQSFFIRVSRREYVGLAKYRHLEDPDFNQGDG